MRHSSTPSSPWPPSGIDPVRGGERLYVDHVLQADRGADLDSLVGCSGDDVVRESL
ncbi:MAG: hypothetical protein H0V05_06325 [Euzebyaceae bacterium]|jgi:dihydroxy-acid dehydratase|nr:hypothetical protein [Euzebyaceae bacterium]